MNCFRFGLALCAPLVLMACNTSTGTATATTPTAAATMAATTASGPNKPKLEALQEKNQTLKRSTMVDLPTTGSATYSGYAQVISDRSVIPTTSTELVGQATLKVGFAGTGSMSGTVENFDDQGTAYGGSLAVSDGAISTDTNGPLVRGNIKGTLTKDGAAYDINGKISGGFFGAGGEYLNGFDDITVTSGGKTSATNISLNAEKQ